MEDKARAPLVQRIARVKAHIERGQGASKEIGDEDEEMTGRDAAPAPAEEQAPAQAQPVVAAPVVAAPVEEEQEQARHPEEEFDEAIASREAEVAEPLAKVLEDSSEYEFLD